MKLHNLLLVAFLGTTIPYLYSMDQDDLFGRSFILDGSSSQSLSDSGIEEALQPLTKPSFLKFYTSINNYLQTKSTTTLADAKISLKSTIDYKPLLSLNPFGSFLENKNPSPDDISKVKSALNGSYFKQNPQDLCKSIPYFLQSIDNNKEETIKDAHNILDKLAKEAQANISSINAIKQTVTETTLTTPRLDTGTIKKCLILLEETCKFFPTKAFKNASHELTDILLFSLLNYTSRPDYQQSIVEQIISNIAAMIDYISSKKNHEDSARITDLQTIKDTIKQTIQKKETFTFEQIRQWQNKIEDITETTLNPNELLTSSLQLDALDTKRKQHKEELQKQLQDEEAKRQEQKEKEEQADFEVFRNASQDDIIKNSEKLLQYMTKYNWNDQIKIYALQILYWQAHKLHDASLMLQAIKTLKKLNADAPRIIHQKGITSYPVFTYYGELSPEQQTVEVLIEQLKQLPDNTPIGLKKLFDRIQNDLLEVHAKNPGLAIESKYKDIEDQKKYLKDFSTEIAKITQEAEKAKAQIPGRIPFAPIKEKSFEEIKAALKIDDDYKGPRPKKRNRYGAEKAEEIRTKIKEIENLKTETTGDEELTNFTNRINSYIEETAKKAEEVLTIDPQEKMRKNLESSIARKQQEMEKLIEAQIKDFNKKINKDTDIATLENIQQEVEKYKSHVAQENQQLLTNIEQFLVTLNQLPQIAGPKIDVQLRRIDLALPGLLQQDLENTATQTGLNAIFRVSQEIQNNPGATPAQISRARNYCMQVTKRQQKISDPREAIKKTIKPEVATHIKNQFNEEDIGFLLNQEQYTHFPNDIALASLFELLEYVAKYSSSTLKANFQNALSEIINDSINPEKIEEAKQRINDTIKQIAQDVKAAEESKNAPLKTYSDEPKITVAPAALQHPDAQSNLVDTQINASAKPTTYIPSSRNTQNKAQSRQEIYEGILHNIKLHGTNLESAPQVFSIEELINTINKVLPANPNDPERIQMRDNLFKAAYEIAKKLPVVINDTPTPKSNTEEPSFITRISNAFSNIFTNSMTANAINRVKDIASRAYNWFFG